MSRNAFLQKNLHVWEKMPIEGAIHLRSHSIPLKVSIKSITNMQWSGMLKVLLTCYVLNVQIHFYL